MAVKANNYGSFLLNSETTDDEGNVVSTTDNSFTINLTEPVSTVIQPGSADSGNVKKVSGSLKVSAIGYYNGEEYWKVNTTEDGSVVTAWIPSHELCNDDTIYDSPTDRYSYAAAIGSEDAAEAMRYDNNLRQAEAGDANLEAYTQSKSAYGILSEEEVDEASDTITVNGKQTSQYQLWLNRYGNDVSCLDAYVSKMVKIFGLPPQWTSYVDPRLDFGTHLVGRRFSETIMASPTILSLCPGKLKYSNKLSDAVSNNSETDLVESLTNGTFDPFWGFDENWEGSNGSYINCCNILCAYAAICLSIDAEQGNYSEGGEVKLSDRTTPWGGTYKSIDVSKFLASEDYSDSNILYSSSISDFLRRYVNNFTKLDKHFVHFNANGSLNVSEDFSTETRASMIESMINSGIADTAKDIAFLTNGVVGAEVQSDLDTFTEVATSTLGGTIGSLFSAATEILKGGTISFPQVIDSCSWGRSFNFTTKFVTVYGDVESRFLNVIMPYLCLAAFFLPRQLSNTIDMYTYPPVVKAFARGLYACDCGVLTGIQVKRGGDDDTAWTASGQPMEISVTFTIKSMHQTLMQSSSRIWFYKNTGLQLYIGTLCGVDMTVHQTELVTMTMEAFTSGFFMDIGRNISYGIWRAINNNPINKLIRNLTNAGQA